MIRAKIFTSPFFLPLAGTILLASGCAEELNPSDAFQSDGLLNGTQLKRQIATSSDDAEENLDNSGRVSVRSRDLEMAEKGGRQVVGLRFPSLAIPRGAQIQKAHIQFTVFSQLRVEDIHSEDAQLSLHGEATDHAYPFISAPRNISRRERTMASVYWPPSPWNTPSDAGREQATPDLAPIVQEIIDRDGWRSRQAMAFMIGGRGTRVASAYDGNPDEAPTLHITYDSPTPTPAPSTCGDRECSITENCLTCPTDCGECPPSGPCAWSSDRYLDPRGEIERITMHVGKVGQPNAKPHDNKLEFETLEAALLEATEATEEVLIILGEGDYEITDQLNIPTSVNIASEYFLDGNPEHIGATRLHLRRPIVTTANEGIVRFIGLTFLGYDTRLIVANDRVDLMDSRLVGGRDQLSFEPAAYGWAHCNTFESSKDDAIDVDTSAKHNLAFIKITNNIITGAKDDGIKVGFFARNPGSAKAPHMRYDIHHNKILGSGEDGIQFVDAATSIGDLEILLPNDNTRTVRLFRNLIVDSGEAGIGCMPEMRTVQNLGGAPGMKEPMYIVNNTIVGGKVGVTGGEHTIVLNSIITGQTVAAVKHVKEKGFLGFTLFDGKNEGIVDSVEWSKGSNFNDKKLVLDPKTYHLAPASFGIDRGLDTFRDASFFRDSDILVFDPSSLDSADGKPDLGAFEFEYPID